MLHDNQTFTDLKEKWSKVLNNEKFDKIESPYVQSVVARLMENTVNDMESADTQSRMRMLSEAAPTNNSADLASGSNVERYDPVLISLLRRSMPKLISYDIMGVQPMSGPVGLIFALKSQYANSTSMTGEALFDEADTTFTGTGTQANTTGQGTTARTGSGVTTANMEANNAFAEMGFTIDKVAVTAKSRAVKAEYTTELAQDLKAVHGLDAEQELASILQKQVLFDTNREAIRAVYTTANTGAADTAVAGTFNLDVDSNGRWMVEKFKGLCFQIDLEANKIAINTRMGRGNFVICSSDVASALRAAGELDYTPGLVNNLNIDDTGDTLTGVLKSGQKVYIDPYYGNHYMVVGYKGGSPWDAGMFYCPYVPLQMVRALGENNFQPKIGFKTRYGMVANPFATAAGDGVVDAYDGTVGANNQNKYYRRVLVRNVM